ncbi:MAG: hypothetical protein COV44_07100 [Deltaproteobacteria bacterium CG11_big_fil_rev_8_21_14_0_20_45_16]|nr:MAG: hypothetical protein COV44_07100 [Deltaproteobacteria bacterium CG11_big_fil_rev_8_21_14_0_20_45_16]
MDGFEAGAKTDVRPKTILISTIKTLPDHFNQAVVHQKYVVEGFSIKQIAKQLSLSTAAILDSLKRFGIDSRPQGGNSNRPSWAPYGKRYQFGKLVEHKGESRVIKTIIKPRFLRGDTLSSIVDFLHSQNIQTKKGGLKWQTEQIRQILLREGIYRSKRKPRGSGKSPARLHKQK